jgi:hypothetical protein
MPSNLTSDRRLRTLWVPLLLATALATHACDEYVFQGFNYDKRVQAAAGQAWLDGLGFSTVHIGAAGEFVREPLRQWPAGYSLLYAVAMRTVNDPLIAAFVIDLTAMLLFLIAWHAILSAAGEAIAMRTRAILWAYWALVWSPALRLPSSDLVAAACFSAALAIAVNRRRPPMFFVVGVAAGIAAAVRYAYWPLAPLTLLPAFVNRAVRWPAAAWFAAGAAAPVGWTVYVNQSAAPIAAPATAPGALPGLSLHPAWRQLLTTRPFGASVLGIDAAWSRASESVSAVGWMLPAAFWVFTVIVLAIWASSLTRIFMRRPRGGEWLMINGIGLAVFVITAALVASLAVLVPAYSDGWTYATDVARYLAPAYPFMFLMVAAAAAERRGVTRAAAVSVLLIAAPSVAAYRAGQMVWFLSKNVAVQSSGPVPRRQFREVFAAVRLARARSGTVYYCDANSFRRDAATIAGAVAPWPCDRQDPVASGERWIGETLPDGRVRIVSQ